VQLLATATKTCSLELLKDMLAMASGIVAMVSGWACSQLRVILLAMASDEVHSSQWRVVPLAVASDECQYGQKHVFVKISPNLLVLSSK
jgi:hypothetical protein